MQYKTIDEQLKQAILILEKNTELMDILDYVYKLKLPNFYIASGIIFQTIWNYYDNLPLNNNVKDIDIIYYNKDDISVEKDLEYYDLINNYRLSKGYTFGIDVSNEARMHLWKKEKLNIDIEPYINSEDTIGKWVATINSIGLTKDKDGLKIYAPYGLSDIYSRTIRPIKQEYTSKDIYNKKVKSWSKRFNNLNIIKW
ncbi:MAG: nucleotidyltransferase family protein [Bacilli bacterium]|nr:nucleotidyltransferase family protein [Bacilli bacterium]